MFCLVGFLGFFDSANSVLSVPDSAHIQPEVVQSSLMFCDELRLVIFP